MQERAVIVSDDSSQRVQKNWDCHTIDGDDHFELCRPDSKKHIGYRKLVESIQSCVQSEPKFKEPINTDEDPIDTGGYPMTVDSLPNPGISMPASIDKDQYFLASCNSEEEHSASTGKFQHFVSKCHIRRRLQPIHDDVDRFVQKIYWPMS